MTERHIIVVDCETNGLDIDRHQVVEVAWWNLTTDERGTFIPQHNPSEILASADIEALRINRYIDRIAGQPQDWQHKELLNLWEQFGDFDEDNVDDEHGAGWIRHTLAGSNSTFDAGMLRKLFARLHNYFEIDEFTPWHHRLWDVSAYAAGVLGLDQLPGLHTVCELLDIPPPDHTAEGDVTATGRCFRKLQLLVAGRSAA